MAGSLSRRFALALSVISIAFSHRLDRDTNFKGKRASGERSYPCVKANISWTTRWSISRGSRTGSLAASTYNLPISTDSLFDQMSKITRPARLDQNKNRDL
jgi:hypothetical protein